MQSINQFHYAKVGDKKWIKVNNLWNEQYSVNKNNLTSKVITYKNDAPYQNSITNL